MAKKGSGLCVIYKMKVFTLLLILSLSSCTTFTRGVSSFNDSLNKKWNATLNNEPMPVFNDAELYQKNNIYYQVGKRSAFTGINLQNIFNGEVKTTYKNGIKRSMVKLTSSGDEHKTIWHPNGNKAKEIIFESQSVSSETKCWHDNGDSYNCDLEAVNVIGD